MSREIKRIFELVEVFNNIRVPLSSKQREILEKKYPYYGAQGIVDYVDNYLFDGEYILIAEDGENLRTRNQNICNLVTGKFWVNNHAHIVSANTNNITKYLYYNFNRINFEPFVTGSAQPKLNKENLLNIKTYVHDFPTQQKIAYVLSTLDAKIELNNRINAELEAMAKTIYDYWFVQFDFPDKNGKPYKTSGGKMIWNEELNREVPEGWEVGELKDIANITMGQSPPGESYNEDGVGNIFYQGCTDFGQRFPTIRKYTKSPTRFANQGDILLSVRAPVGNMNIASEYCCIGRGLAALSSKNNSITFLYGVMTNLKQVFDRRNTDGTTFGSITKDDLFTLKVVIPPSKIISQFDSYLGTSFHMQNNIQKQNQQLASLRDWLLPMLMNGQVSVGEIEEEIGTAAEPKVGYGNKKKQ